MEIDKTYKFEDIENIINQMFPKYTIEWTLQQKLMTSKKPKYIGAIISYGTLARNKQGFYEITVRIVKYQNGKMEINIDPGFNTATLMPLIWLFAIIPPIIFGLIFHLTLFRNQRIKYEKMLLEELNKL